MQFPTPPEGRESSVRVLLRVRCQDGPEEDANAAYKMLRGMRVDNKFDEQNQPGFESYKGRRNNICCKRKNDRGRASIILEVCLKSRYFVRF